MDPKDFPYGKAVVPMSSSPQGENDNDDSNNEQESLYCTPDIDVNFSASPTLYSSNEALIDMKSRLLGFGLAPTTKRKHHVLPLETKIELIRRLENGEPVGTLAKEYNVGRNTIFDIRNKKDSIISFASRIIDDNELKSRKTVRKKPGKKSLSKFMDVKDIPALMPSDSSSSDKRKATNKNDSNPQPSDPSTSDQNQMAGAHGTTSGSGTTTGKRKHIVLSIDTKIEIIQRLEKGETAATLAPLYNIGKATISDIRSKKDSILTFASKLKSEEGLKNRKTMRKANDTCLENAVYTWYIQKLRQGEIVTGPLLCEKALELNSKLGGPADFKASSGWLKNFRSRHGIKQLRSEKEMVTFDPVKENHFLRSYYEFLEQEGYTADDIYAVDETEIDWQTMPENSLAYRTLSVQEGRVAERVIVLACANASWSHSLPLFMIGKDKKSQCFGKVACLPLIYKSNKNGRIDSEIFMEWYAKEFILRVKKEREICGRYGKVLLILDNAPYHPVADMLNVVDENFSVMFLPPNVNTLIHPLDKNVIKKLKRTLKKQIIRRLLLATDNEESMIHLAKKLSIRDCSYMLADSWKTMTQHHLQDYLKKLYVNPLEFESVDHQADEEKDLREFAELFKALPGFASCSMENAREWLKIDSHDPGETILDEDEIITSAMNDESTEKSDDDDGEKDGDEGENNYPNHSEAFNAFDIAMEWCERQKECCPEQLILLKQLQDLAAKKMWIKTDESKLKK